jgi:hypothetical protein
MGITGKKGLWEALRDRGVAAAPGVDFERLAIRAEEQRAAVEDLHHLTSSKDPHALDRAYGRSNRVAARPIWAHVERRTR